MKHRDLTKQLETGGFKFKRHGSDHDIYANGQIAVQVPRHKEIKENTAKQILKDAGLK